ncbi:unnamed protein product [Blepharisma stoltei]|uniref:Protein kinase domain-containing protein n=1 Tax=Blepharisma stoltei TaxID=1481888 RepID=A0AAU9IPI4_9CILI|nr:unnamed protein product [Blepharisma stoltei]
MGMPAKTITQIDDLLTRGNEILDYIKIFSFEQLKKEKASIKHLLLQFSSDDDAKHLYHAHKVSLVFKSPQLAWRDCISGLKAAKKLQKTFNGILQTVILNNLEKISSSIYECKELEGIWKISEELDFISQYIHPWCKSILEKSINKSLDSICSSENKEILKRSLLFLSEVKTDRKSELNEVIISISYSTLEWIKKRKEILSRNSEAETLQNFKDASEELIDLIKVALIKIDNLQEKVNPARNKISKMIDEIGITRIRNRVMDESKIDFLPDDEKLLNEKIIKSKIIYDALDYMGEKVRVLIQKGWFDNNLPICIKGYYYKLEAPPCEIFKSDLLLTKYLSENHNLFLKYFGWTFENRVKCEDGIYCIYSIITEDFPDVLLIDDIITRRNNNQKYSYAEYSIIVKSLLMGFSWLESEKILHLNLKPHNIFITRDKKIKVAGFNSSRTYIEDDFSCSNNKEWHDLYIAPEIYLKSLTEKKFDLSFAENADIYSLGLIFMQMYSLLPIKELNTPEYYEEINDYVSTFKPNNVANLLKGMLAIDSAQRVSFKDSLRNFINEEEKGHTSIQAKIYEPIKDHNLIENHLADLLRIEESMLQIKEDFGIKSKSLPYGVSLEFRKGFYYDRPILIRTYKHQDEKELLPYIKEARLLQFLAGRHSTFIDYYGLIYNSSQPDSLSLITERCNWNLMEDITHRQNKGNFFDENALKTYIGLLLEGFAVLKQLNIDHKNIKAYNILFNSENSLKITGFAVPETEIISICKFPENQSDFFQTEDDYWSPKKEKHDGISQIDFEKSDVYSLGLVIWQMVTLCHTSTFNLNCLSQIRFPWISYILKWMLCVDPNRRKDFAGIYQAVISIMPH